MAFLSDRAVGERYEISKTTVWRWLKADPSFPRPVTLSAGCTRWRLVDLERWEAVKCGVAAQVGEGEVA